jgi:hypothetical protein
MRSLSHGAYFEVSHSCIGKCLICTIITLCFIYIKGGEICFSRLGVKMNEVLLSGLKRIIMGEIWLIYAALHFNLYEFLLVI